MLRERERERKDKSNRRTVKDDRDKIERSAKCRIEINKEALALKLLCDGDEKD